MQMHCKSTDPKRGQPERLSLFFSQKSLFSHRPTAEIHNLTRKICNFATPKLVSDRPKRL